MHTVMTQQRILRFILLLVLMACTTTVFDMLSMNAQILVVVQLFLALLRL